MSSERTKSLESRRGIDLAPIDFPSPTGADTNSNSKLTVEIHPKPLGHLREKCKSLS